MESLPKPMGCYVGELRERWQFPSDHLPIGLTLKDLQIASWNVLNALYVEPWIETQGLKRSQIVKEHYYIEGTKLTYRDQRVAQTIRTMALRSRSLFCLQECSKAFIEELRLPAHFEVLFDGERAVVYSKEKLKLIDIKTPSGIFGHVPDQTVQDLLFQDFEQNLLRIINVHIPGEPDKPSRYEFAGYLKKTFNPQLTTLCSGDMNFNELEMEEALRALDLPFSVLSPYCTNISPITHISKAIDHFLLYLKQPIPISLTPPEELLGGLSRMVELLHPKIL